MEMINAGYIGLIFSIVFFTFASLSAFYIWFRDGANKLSKGTLKFLNQNDPDAVSLYHLLSQHPLVWKIGSLLILFGGFFAIFLAIKEIVH